MSSAKMEEIRAIKEFIDSQLNFAGNFIEFILAEKSVESYNKRIAKLRILQSKIQRATGRFLTVRETLRHQNNILNILIHWNKDISAQLLNLVYFHVDFNKQIDVKKPVTLKEQNPFQLMFKNREKFLQADSVFGNVLRKGKENLFGEFDMYAIFYCLIGSVESMEYPMYESLRVILIKNNLHKKYDIDNIFSVTTKKKAKKSKTGYQTDSRMMRNALGHFDYSFDWKENGFNVTFNSLVDSSDTMTLTDVEFFKFISNHRFLLQSILIINGIMAAFSTLRCYFATDT